MMNSFDNILASEPIDKLARNGLTNREADDGRSYIRPKHFNLLVVKRACELRREQGVLNKDMPDIMGKVREEIAVALGYENFGEYLTVIKSRGLRYGKLTKKELQKKKQVNTVQLSQRIFKRDG